MQTMLRFLLLSCGLVWTAFVSAAEPSWIWSQQQAASKADAGECAFRKTFQATRVGDAKLEIAADNRFELFINGRHVGSGEGWNQRHEFNVTPLLLPGRNLIAVRAVNDGADPAGLMVKLNLKPTIGAAETIVSDASWKFDLKPARGWQTAEFDDSKWSAAVELGAYGKTAPWGNAGPIVAAETGPSVTKGRNPERGLFEFKDGDRLVLLGSAFIERMQSNGYFELELQCAFPDKKISVRNLGWSGDTVWGDARAVFGQRADGFKRLVRDVTHCEPTVILVCYGENEAYAGEAGLPDFRRGFETLLNTLEATGARLVIATPRKHENLGKPFPDQSEYNKSLRMYCDVMQEIAKEREHNFVDWFGSQQNPATQPLLPLSDNGVHLSAYGYYELAPFFVASLGGIPYDNRINISKNSLDVQGSLITELKSSTGLSFTQQLRRLPLCDLADKDRTEIVTGAGHLGFLTHKELEFGRYELWIDGEKELNYEFTAKDNYAEIPLRLTKSTAITKQLLQLIQEKDFLFFNRHRPQNETYLFLFRKHEQGNNAVEIPQFDPLINELDKKIAELKKPVKQKYELRRVEK
jgi:lysophospholipase L1-like esterase